MCVFERDGSWHTVTTDERSGVIESTRRTFPDESAALVDALEGARLLKDLLTFEHDAFDPSVSSRAIEAEAAVVDSESIDMSDVAIPSADAGRTYRERLAARRPDLTAPAIAALTNRWFYRRLWLDAPSAVARQAEEFEEMFAGRLYHPFTT
ncbi:hypothetical protein GCM10009775_14830 [Microbacterium aoyamense]|uniref:Uncharacterized protein n=1 Tax=Microbacterium aoyamense TaxID=344166 RepID=A0ABN2PLA4_9MICO|nr:hypothetical protein [Microbacterium aoyamense]